MRFGSIGEESYASLKDLNPARAELIEANKVQIEKLKEVLFDYDVDEIFLADSFTNKEVFDVRKICVYIETTQKGLDGIINRRVLDEFHGFCFYISNTSNLIFLDEGTITFRASHKFKTISLGKVWKSRRST